jgi:hypothetical protein
MQVLVSGNEHPIEMQAAKIFEALRTENTNPKVQYLRVPFEKTMYGYMNKALKALLDKEELQKRLDNIDVYGVSAARDVVQIMAQDLRNPRADNKSRVNYLIGHYPGALADIYSVFPEIKSAFDTRAHMEFVSSSREKCGADVAVSLHNSEAVAECKRYNIKGHMKTPFVLTFSSVGEKNGLNEKIMGLGEEHFDFWQPFNGNRRDIKVYDEPRYCIEIPAASIRTKFYDRAIIGCVGANDQNSPSWYQTAFLTNLPFNMEMFNFQKEETKRIIETIVSHPKA